MGEMVFMSGLPALLASCAHFCGVASLTQALSPIVNAVAAPAVSAVSASMTLPLIAGTTAGTLMFSNTPLLLPAGSSEPEIAFNRSEEHTSELQSLRHLVCRLLLEKKKKKTKQNI